MYRTKLIAAALFTLALGTAAHAQGFGNPFRGDNGRGGRNPFESDKGDPRNPFGTEESNNPFGTGDDRGKNPFGTGDDRGNDPFRGGDDRGKDPFGFGEGGGRGGEGCVRPPMINGRQKVLSVRGIRAVDVLDEFGSDVIQLAATVDGRPVGFLNAGTFHRQIEGVGTEIEGKLNYRNSVRIDVLKVVNTAFGGTNTVRLGSFQVSANARGKMIQRVIFEEGFNGRGATYEVAIRVE